MCIHDPHIVADARRASTNSRVSSLCRLLDRVIATACEGPRHEPSVAAIGVHDQGVECTEPASGIGLAELDPLRPGIHTIDLSWIMSATHCDGLVDGGCLMAGDNIEPFPIEIEVLPGR